MSQIIDGVLAIMAKFGYLGIAFAMFLENIFPPIPSELIMPAAGFAVAKGELQLILVIIAGTIGATLGALPFYYLGYVFNEDRLSLWVKKYEKVIFIKVDDVTAASRWFERHGSKAVFFGRMVPGVRSLISIPAGINKMPLGRFLLFTLLGSSLWTTALTLLGYYLGKNYTLIEAAIAPYSKIFLAISAILVIGWLIKQRLRRRQSSL